MNPDMALYQNEQIISSLKRVATNTALKVCRNTDGVIDNNATTAKELSANLELVNNVVDQELTRRFGE